MQTIYPTSAYIFISIDAIAITFRMTSEERYFQANGHLRKE